MCLLFIKTIDTLIMHVDNPLIGRWSLGKKGMDMGLKKGMALEKRHGTAPS